MARKQYTGYGKKDAQLARDLNKTRSKPAADRVARSDGHRNAGAARNWLRGRSS